MKLFFPCFSIETKIFSSCQGYWHSLRQENTVIKVTQCLANRSVINQSVSNLSYRVKLAVTFEDFRESNLQGNQGENYLHIFACASGLKSASVSPLVPMMLMEECSSSISCQQHQGAMAENGTGEMESQPQKQVNNTVRLRMILVNIVCRISGKIRLTTKQIFWYRNETFLSVPSLFLVQ